MIPDKKLKGGALYIALIISVITGIILSLFIVIASYNQRLVLSQSGLIQLQFNVQSGINLAQSAYFNEEMNNKWMLLDNEDSIRIKKIQWGAYTIISSESKNKKQYTKTAALYGINISKDTAIVVADNGRPVGLSGTIKFTGNCYFPAGAIKPAYIEGESFNSEGLIRDFIKAAPPFIPPVKKEFTEQLQKSVKYFNAGTDSLIENLPDFMLASFSGKTCILQNRHTHLENCYLSGNIKINCKEVIIDSTCYTDNILIIAEKAIIKPGFKGSLHIIATDSIVIEKRCVLEYPSSLTVIRDKIGVPNLKGIFIDETVIVHGSVMAINLVNENNTEKVFVKLNKNVEVYGLVYSSDYAHLQGKMFGNVFCGKLLLKTSSAVYENHMLSCEIDSKKHAQSILIPGIFKSVNNLKCCKWL